MRKFGSFLMKGAMTIPVPAPEGEYDRAVEVNVHRVEGRPLVLVHGQPPTQSKTAARPGDDDPDPGHGRCY